MVRKKPAAENPLLRLEVSKKKRKKSLCSHHGKFHHFHFPVNSEMVADVDGRGREKQKSDRSKDYRKIESVLPVMSN